MTWYIYAKIIKGVVLTIPSKENLKASKSLKFYDGFGTNFLSVKNTIITAIQRYIEQSTPNRELYLRAEAFLGIDIGIITQKVNIKHQNTSPSLLLLSQSGKLPLPNGPSYYLIILGIAVLT